MKTDDLIRALVADNMSNDLPIGRTLALCLLAGIAGAAIIFAATMGARADFSYSILYSPRFQYKFLVTIALALAAFSFTRSAMRPDGNVGRRVWLLAVPALLLFVALALEMWTQPVEHWAIYALGQNAAACLTMIPLMALAPLGAILFAMRRGAPSHPAAAGAATGLLAGGISATLYAAHCSDDSPLFVAIWYSLAVIILTGVGAVLGRHLLKW